MRTDRLPVMLLVLCAGLLTACDRSAVDLDDSAVETRQALDPTSLVPVGPRIAAPIPEYPALRAVAPAAAADVLVFGDYSPSRDELAAVLTGMGHNVTNAVTMPEDLSPFDAVWHVGAFVPLTTGEQSLLAAFLAGGGGVHLTGERPCCEALNASLQTLINDVVVGGGVAVGNLGDFSPQFTFNPTTVDGITTQPNVLDKWSPAAPGAMSGVAPDNILVTHDETGSVNGAAWACSDLVSGSGRLTILMDVNWLQPLFNPPATRDPEIENIQAFLQLACIIPVAIDVRPGSHDNPINPKSNGVVPVVILGNVDFDVTEIDVTTLAFGPDGATPDHDLTNPATWTDHLQDVNGDGYTDLVAHFRQKDVGFQESDVEGCIAGATLGGTPIAGCDTVSVLQE